MRKSQSYQTESVGDFKDRLLAWAQQYEQIVWLDNNFHNESYHLYEAVLALGHDKKCNVMSLGSFDELENFIEHKKDWLFGYFSYDLKNKLEDLESSNFDGLYFPELYFFQPQKLIKIIGNRIEFGYQPDFADEMEKDYDAIMAFAMDRLGKDSVSDPVKIKMRIHKDAYFQKADRFLKHIKRGDIYEANFCQEFYAVETVIDPLTTYKRLNEISNPPFATFMRLNGLYLLSASPERYLKKEKNKVISQPIKGTAPRSKDPGNDNKLKATLEVDLKERAENVMIVDLVRNDLSRLAKKGSVEVEELCKVYSFKQVHQMISTVTCEVDQDVRPVDIIKQTFPMGSMTGTPKVSAMKIIEELEETKRGLYSGAVGYFDPQGDFDFNVVIRSILYNQLKKYVSYSVGSAITARSIPEKEYQECLLKAKAMREVLSN